MGVLEQMNSLEGKVAIITGASRGLGKEMSLYLARAGCDIVGTARGVPDLEAAMEEVRALGRRALAIPTDVTSKEQIDGMVARAISEMGHVDIMISNAGGGGVSKPIWEIDIETELRPMLAIDMDTHFFCAQAVAEHMVQRGRGKIMFSGSAAYWNKGGRLGYIHSMAEGGTAQLARSLAMTYARDNIQVNALGIGMFSTHAYTAPREDASGQPRRSQSQHERFLPAKRYGDPSEIGPYTVFLSSDASNYLTGQVVYIDGGVQPAGFAPIDYFPTVPLTRF